MVKGIFLSQSTACPLVVTVGAVICVLHNHSHTWSPASFFKYQFCRMFNWSFFYILLSFWIAHFLIAGRTRDNLPSLASAPLPDNAMVIGETSFKGSKYTNIAKSTTDPMHWVSLFVRVLQMYVCIYVCVCVCVYACFSLFVTLSICVLCVFVFVYVWLLIEAGTFRDVVSWSWLWVDFIFVTVISDHICGENSVMWRNFRFLLRIWTIYGVLSKFMPFLF